MIEPTQRAAHDRLGAAEVVLPGGGGGAGEPTIESMLRAAPARLGATKLVLIDGHSGAGKTTFADELNRSVGGELVHTDDLLDGWDDQFTYWKRLVRNVFEPIADGRPGGYRRYDWVRGKFVEWVAVKPAPVLIVEGVGAARADGRALASLSIFIDAPRSVRETRSLARDGETMQAHLDEWRHREDLHFGADATLWCADLVIGSAQNDPLHPGALQHGCGRRTRAWSDPTMGN